jgi:hypothetical protein
MKVGIYTTAFNIIKNNFDYKDAIRNWLLYADHISIAVNTSDDDTLNSLYREGNFWNQTSSYDIIHII